MARAPLARIGWAGHALGEGGPMAQVKLTLPEDVISWIQSVTGEPVTEADRIPGGATREGWFVDVATPEGSTRELFVRYSPAALPERGAFHRLGTEAAIMKALAPQGVAVPTILGVHPQREAVLSERVGGATWFYRIKDPDEQVRVAQDFIRNLARWHGLDPENWGSTRSGRSRRFASTLWIASRGSAGAAPHRMARWTHCCA